MKVYVAPELKRAVECAASTVSLANKCLLFVSELYLKATEKDDEGLEKPEFFPLMSKIGEKIYTRRGYCEVKSTLTALKPAGIEIDDSYLSQAAAKKAHAERNIILEAHSKGYRLALHYFNAAEFEIDD